ncbi:MAG: hypothetical protein AAFX44_07410 [Pseudomonadota bacterium]
MGTFAAGIDFRWGAALGYAAASIVGIVFIEIQTQADFKRTWVEYTIYAFSIAAFGFLGGLLGRFYDGRLGWVAAIWIPLVVLILAPLLAGFASTLLGMLAGTAQTSFDSLWRGSALIAVLLLFYGFPTVPAAVLVSVMLARSFSGGS